MRKIACAAFITFLIAPSIAFAEAGKTISKQEFGDKWPLSVDRGIVKCLPIGNGAVVFEANGKTYAVNGTARGFAKKRGFLLIDEIWIDDPNYHQMIKEIAESEKKSEKEIMKIIKPTKVSIGPVLDSGVSLCR